MPGFFTKAETQSKTRPDGKVYSCVSCGLYKGDLDHPKMQPTGNFKKKILNIGEFTTARDDKKGKPFQSKGSSKLYSIYSQLGIDLEEDCLNVNAVMCHPYVHKTGKARVPTAFEVQCCRINIVQAIKEYQPKLIVLFGKIALDSVIGLRIKDALGSMDKWRGFVIPDQYYKAWIAPVYDPSYVIHKNDSAYDMTWEEDLKNAIQHLDIPFREFKEPKITYLKDDLSPLNKIRNNTLSAFDYEATGLKPHAEGHRIVCASIADSEDHVYSFMLINKKQKQLRGKKIKPFLNFLRNKEIPKVAQHMKYEENWSFTIFGIRVKGWKHDTMLFTHIFDNRTGITGLKFQAYICFGIDEYNSEIEPYLKAKDSNSLNTLLKFVSTKRGIHTCLKYCAYDSILELRLAKLQETRLNNEILPF